MLHVLRVLFILLFLGISGPLAQSEPSQTAWDTDEEYPTNYNGSTVLGTIQECLSEATMLTLDRLLKQKAVLLLDGVMLVRRNDSHENETGDLRESKVVRRNGILSRLMSMMKTHALYVTAGSDVKESGRLRRHHYKHMFPLMVVGFMTMSSFLVPMGFQFMAMLAGKALLLSKMALMVASSQSYKRLGGYLPLSLPYQDVYHGHWGYHDRIGGHQA